MYPKMYYLLFISIEKTHNIDERDKVVLKVCPFELEQCGSCFYFTTSIKQINSIVSSTSRLGCTDEQCSQTASLQCRRILGGRNLARVRNIVVAAIFDFMTVEDSGE